MQKKFKDEQTKLFLANWKRGHDTVQEAENTRWKYGRKFEKQREKMGENEKIQQ